VILFENVRKQYFKDAPPALKNISLNIDPGEFVFLVGPSGSGKSTFLNLILRLEMVNDGRLIVAGQNLTTIAKWRIPKYRQDLGVVFQGFKLLNKKTVFENIAFKLKILGMSNSRIRPLVSQAISVVDLEGKENRFPHELSGGEQQRVAIARAFVNRPPIILADEPTGNLDPATSDGIMNVFEEINQTGTLILMATHNEQIVNRARHRVIELSKGELIRDEAEGFYDSYLSAKMESQLELQVDQNEEQHRGVNVESKIETETAETQFETPTELQPETQVVPKIETEIELQVEQHEEQHEEQQIENKIELQPKTQSSDSSDSTVEPPKARSFESTSKTGPKISTELPTIAQIVETSENPEQPPASEIQES
jgi:cell division transport system ATP-binding protein